MRHHRFFLFTIFFLITLTAYTVTSRAVNISNTWTLPEDDFPVFYRYFRDSISWFEADAVCQFHHGNLVTADSSSQYDAIRAYLKELDITDNVWIGLSRGTDKTTFTWSSGNSLSNEGHWREPIPAANEALCVTMDPTGDFLWRPQPCGGPQVASFICELPVPSWALGLKGCLLTELPSLTVLYIPEQMALELTSDCGFEGTKRITCRGNADRETMLKELSCDDLEEKSSGKPTSTSTDVSDASFASFKPTKPWTSNTIEMDYVPTRHRRETENTQSPSAPTPTIGLILDKSNPNKNEDSTELLFDQSSTSSDVLLVEVTSPVSESDTTSSKDRKQIWTSTYVSSTKQEATDGDIRRFNYDLTTTSTVASRRLPEAPIPEDIAEFPSAINQGQLFSIIENGTMFDIIELNETAVEESKASKTTDYNPQQITEEKFTTVNSKNVQVTTTLYEPQPKNNVKVSDKLNKKYEGKSKTEYYKKSDPKKINFPSEKETRKIKEMKTLSLDIKNEDKSLNKEFEIYPILSGSNVKLNRTHRKEIPIAMEINTLNKDQHQNETKEEDNTNFYDEHIEIHFSNNKTINGSFIITTKRQKKINDTIQDLLKNETEVSTESLINAQITTLPNSESSKQIVETKNLENKFVHNETVPLIQSYPNPNKEPILEKSLLGEIGLESNENATVFDKDENFLDSEPLQKKPNRKRTLNNNQRRSYYPYFFSRVLG